MPRYQVRYHRSIPETAGRAAIPSGTFLESIDGIPAEFHDRIQVVEEVHEAEVRAPVIETRPRHTFAKSKAVEDLQKEG